MTVYNYDLWVIHCLWKLLRPQFVKQILVIDGWSICCELALIWMSLDFTDDQSTLVQVMAWCHQAPSHHLSQCWPRTKYTVECRYNMVQYKHNHVGNIILHTSDLCLFCKNDITHWCQLYFLKFIATFLPEIQFQCHRFDLIKVQYTMDPFYQHRLLHYKVIWYIWISNYTHCKMWDEISSNYLYTFSSFKGDIV